jgi:hypothetical protein
MRARIAADPTFALHKRLSHHMRRALGRGSKRGRSWVALVGYGPEALRTHIERQFTKGMAWTNMADWEIDHIVPIAAFGSMEPGDDAFLRCWALTNLRPLWKRLNQSKGGRREHLL